MKKIETTLWPCNVLRGEFSLRQQVETLKEKLQEKSEKLTKKESQLKETRDKFKKKQVKLQTEKLSARKLPVAYLRKHDR